MKRGNVEPFKRLNFDNMPLVPVNYRTWPYDRYPHNIKLQPDSWHVPGRRIMTTSQLVELANIRGVAVTLTENSGEGESKTTSLN